MQDIQDSVVVFIISEPMWFARYPPEPLRASNRILICIYFLVVAVHFWCRTELFAPVLKIVKPQLLPTFYFQVSFANHLCTASLFR